MSRTTYASHMSALSYVAGHTNPSREKQSHFSGTLWWSIATAGLVSIYNETLWSCRNLRQHRRIFVLYVSALEKGCHVRLEEQIATDPAPCGAWSSFQDGALNAFMMMMMITTVMFMVVVLVVYVVVVLPLLLLLPLFVLRIFLPHLFVLLFWIYVCL